MTNNQHSRHLDLEGAYNIRDIGGYETVDSRTVRLRKLFRSDSLHNLAKGSHEDLIGEGLRTVIDLRQSDAVEEKPNVFEHSSDLTYHHLNVMGDGPLVESTDQSVSSLGPDRPPEVYAAILDMRQQWMGKVIKLLATPGALPALYHCNSGRDRAGLTTMLLLSIAGVPKQQIVEDFAMSPRYLWRRTHDKNTGTVHNLHPDDFDSSPEARQAYDTEKNICPPQAMSASIEHIERTYGSVREYLVGGGVTEEEMRLLRSEIVE